MSSFLFVSCYAAVLCYASLYFLNLGGLAIALETDVLRLHDYGFDAPAILDMVIVLPIAHPLLISNMPN